MIGPSFFLEQFLGLVMGEIWYCSKEKIITAYKNYKNSTEEEKSFETRMYTAIVDAFCYYANVTPQNARPDIMDFIYTTAEVYFNESQRKQDDTPATLLDALHSFDSKFGDTTLFKNYKNKEKKDDAKIETVAKYLQKYIVKDDKFKDEYINEVLTRLLRMGQRIEKMQLEQQLFPELVIAAVKESEQSINANTNTTMAKESDRVISVVSDKIDSLGKKRFYEPYTDQEIQHEVEKPKFKDAKEMYAKKWKERLFLHRRPEDEELTLERAFVAPLYYLLNTSFFEFNPHFIEKITYLENEKAKELEAYDNLKEALDQFIIDGRSMLILGQPGMGKSSIVCYLADKYINDPQVLIVKFKDLNIKKSTDQNMDNKSLLLDSIINYFHCDKKDLENKTLILDGYDEIDSYFFNVDLFSDFFLSIREIINFKILITSRENYIIKETHYFEKIILLLPYDAGKIEKFAENIIHDKHVSGYIINNDNNKVFGIPVILYMALASGVDLSKSISRIGVYNKIFSLNGGIFDRFYSQHNDSYETGSHTISYVKIAFYNILCNTAFYMFENFSDNSISHNAYEKIIENEKTKTKELLAKSSEMNSPLWYDFPIENLYEKADNISFIHKSFYEYFTAEYYFNIIHSISKNIIKQDLSANIDKEESNKVIATLRDILCLNMLSDEILEFLQYKINNYFSYAEIEHLKEFYYIIFRIMLSKGMTYKLNKNIKYSTIFVECIIFANMLDFFHLWIKNDEPYYFEFDDSEINQIEAYLNLCNFFMNFPNAKISKQDDSFSSIRLNLSYFNLSGIDLQHIKLNGINFSHCCMKNSTLNNAILQNSNFKSTELQDSSLEGADLSGSFFRETIFANSNISSANFEYSSVPDADFTGCSARNAIFRNVVGLYSATYTHELDNAFFD